jgi:hypothetical protein
MSEESMLGSFFDGRSYPATEHPCAAPTRIDEINGITFMGHIIMTLDDTMTQYQTARAQYKQLIASVYAETDPTRKAAILASLRPQNQKLVDSAQALMTMWNSISTTSTTNQTLASLTTDIQQYQQDLETMKGYTDETTKLSMIYADKTGDASANRTVYFVYIIIILILLVAVFVMFVLRGISGIGSSVAETVESIVPTSAGPTV